MDDRINIVIDYIDNNISKKIDLDKLASLALMSKWHFHKIFKKETGKTPLEYIRQIKMETAYHKVMKGVYTVYAISNQLGYPDYETFSRVFKKYHGLAPGDLKAIALKIKNHLDIGSEDLFIEVIDVETEEEAKSIIQKIINNAKQILLTKGYTADEVKQAKVLSVIPKNQEPKSHQLLVKNKFIIEEKNPDNIH